MVPVVPPGGLRARAQPAADAAPMAVDDEATTMLKLAYGRYQSAAAYHLMGVKEGFPQEVLQPVQAMAELAKAQWEELRPLPVRAASAANKLASAEERV